ncbi:hypothetical protein ACOMHN_067419 [Nucella lapillus]
MAASFVGKWKVDVSTITGFEAFGAAVGLSEEKREKFKNMKYALEFKVSGDTVSATVVYEDIDFPVHTYTFKLGDTIDYHGVDGSEPKLTITMEGGELRENYKLGEASWQTIREVNGNVMTSTTTARGTSVVQKLFKQ